MSMCRAVMFIEQVPLLFTYIICLMLVAPYMQVQIGALGFEIETKKLTLLYVAVFK